MTQTDITTALNEQYTAINNAEEQLRDTDYIALKIAEGAATKEEYADKIAQRQQWRDDINAAQEEIERLNGVTAEPSDFEAAVIE